MNQNQLTLSKNASRAAQMLTYLGQNPQLRNQILAAGKYAVNSGSRLLGFPSGSSSASTAVRYGSSGGRPPRSGAKGKKRGGRRNSGGVPRNSFSAKQVPFCLELIIPLTNNSTSGVANNNFWLGYADTAYGYGSFSTISTIQYVGLSSLYQWQKIHRIQARYEPQVPYTQAGSVATCFNPDPTSIPTWDSYQKVIEKKHSGMSDIKEPHSWTYVPENQIQAESKETTSATSLTGAILRNYAPGAIAVYSSNGTTTSGFLFGNLILTVDLTFSGLI